MPSTGCEGTRAIVDHLRKDSKLTKLLLPNNGIGAPGVTALANFIHRSSTLTVLDISGNIHWDVQGSSTTEIAQALAQSSSLTHINLCSIGLADEQMKEMGSALFDRSETKKPASLCSLSCDVFAVEANSIKVEGRSQNSIGPGVFMLMAAVLISHESARELIVQHQPLSAEGCIILARLLDTGCKTLERLDLRDIGLSKEHTGALAPTMHTHNAHRPYSHSTWSCRYRC